MKTNTKFALAALTALVFAAGTAVANEPEWYTIDNHHGSVLYIPRQTAEVRSQTTVGFVHNGFGIGHRSHSVKRSERGQALHQVSTSQGTVSYFAPAE